MTHKKRKSFELSSESLIFYLTFLIFFFRFTVVKQALVSMNTVFRFSHLPRNCQLAKLVALGEWGVESCQLSCSLKTGVAKGRDWAPIILPSCELLIKNYFSIVDNFHHDQ